MDKKREAFYALFDTTSKAPALTSDELEEKLPLAVEFFCINIKLHTNFNSLVLICYSEDNFLISKFLEYLTIRNDIDLLKEILFLVEKDSEIFLWSRFVFKYLNSIGNFNTEQFIKFFSIYYQKSIGDLAQGWSFNDLKESLKSQQNMCEEIYQYQPVDANIIILKAIALEVLYGTF